MNPSPVPSPSAPPIEEPGLNLQDLLDSLLQGRWLILACSLLIGGAGALYASMASPIYEAMPAACLQALRDHEAELARIDLLQLARLEPGQRVSLRAPLFEGMEGLVQSSDKDRVRVLIELMGRMTEIQLRSHQVQVSG